MQNENIKKLKEDKAFYHSWRSDQVYLSSDSI